MKESVKVFLWLVSYASVFIVLATILFFAALKVIHK